MTTKDTIPATVKIEIREFRMCPFPCFSADGLPGFFTAYQGPLPKLTSAAAYFPGWLSSDGKALAASSVFTPAPVSPIQTRATDFAGAVILATRTNLLCPFGGHLLRSGGLPAAGRRRGCLTGRRSSYRCAPSAGLAVALASHPTAATTARDGKLDLFSGR